MSEDTFVGALDKATHAALAAQQFVDNATALFGIPYRPKWLQPLKDAHEKLSNVRGVHLAALARVEELEEEISIWKSVFPDIAPVNVLPDRSLLEAEIARLREALEWYADEGRYSAALPGLMVIGLGQDPREFTGEYDRGHRARATLEGER